MYCRLHIQSFPVEIHQAVFSYLDRGSLLSCALVSRLWTASAQYTLFRSSSVYSPAAIQKFARALQQSPHLREYVKEFVICGKATGSVQPWIRGAVDLAVLLPDLALLPRLRSLRFEHFDPVNMQPKFAAVLRKFENVTALHLRGCHFYSSRHLEDVVFAFPRLDTLTLDSVRWEGDRAGVFERRPEYELLPLRLRRLRVCNPYEYGPVFAWLRAHRCLNVRHLELIRFDILNAEPAAAYVRDLGPALESLTFGLYLPISCDRTARRLHLGENKALRSLSLQIYDVSPEFVRWAESVLCSAVELPLAHVGLSLTLDAGKTLESAAWGALRDMLATYWRSTLRELAVTHHAVPGFLKHVRPLFLRHFAELHARGVLSVVVDTSQGA